MGSRIFNLHCVRCGARVARYRKEGSGSLVRLYLDRVVEPDSLSALKQATRKSGLPPLNCLECGLAIGLPLAPGPGNRPAYRLIKGSTRKGK